MRFSRRSKREVPSAGRGPVWAVVPAGGGGVRMGRKKQDIALAGRPMLCWTVEALAASPALAGLVVAVPAEDVPLWRRRLAAVRKLGAVVSGGAERQASVARGLLAVPEQVPWILVHDGVRPCITRPLIARVVTAARGHGAAVAALPVAETLKRAAGDWVTETVSRDGLWTIQTPQVFRADLLREAHRQAARDGVTGTDDAALVERLGVPVRLVAGLPGNLKVTRPEDLALCRRLLVGGPSRDGDRAPGRRRGAGVSPVRR